MKKIAIMQPYFLPYLGYFQLINAVDEFVIYDNIQFSKRGWIHRNRILENGEDVFISLPIKRDSDYLDIRDREISENYGKLKHKFLSKIENNYRKAPYFENVMPTVEAIFQNENTNLFLFVLNSILSIKLFLEINTIITVSSQIEIDHDLVAGDKVRAIVKCQNGKIYYNSMGGKQLYSKEDFKKEGIDLEFLKTRDYNYNQFGREFVPFLSIVDTLMFVSKERVQSLLHKFDLS